MDSPPPSTTGDHPFYPIRWQLTDDLESAPKAPRPRPRTRRALQFLKGPIPWPWVQRAMTLPGKALAVGMMLWLQCGLTGRRTVLFCQSHAAAEGASSHAAALPVDSS